jgi:hypothetical protein
MRRAFEMVVFLFNFDKHICFGQKLDSIIIQTDIYIIMNMVEDLLLF